MQERTISIIHKMKRQLWHVSLERCLFQHINEYHLSCFPHHLFSYVIGAAQARARCVASQHLSLLSSNECPTESMDELELSCIACVGLFTIAHYPSHSRRQSTFSWGLFLFDVFCFFRALLACFASRLHTSTIVCFHKASLEICKRISASPSCFYLALLAWCA